MSVKRTNMNHNFSEIPSAEIPRSVFNRSSNLKTTFDSGILVPVFRDMALPGDTMNLRMLNFCRMATPLHPVMDNMQLDSFFFAVPIRLVWADWARFNGAQTDPGDTTEFTIPQITPAVASGGYGTGSLSDYFGLPVDVEAMTNSSLWHRAYALIWSEWFRDENLQDTVNHKPNSPGPDLPFEFPLKRRGKRKDYFTGCLPFAQKGTAVSLPLGTSAPVVPATPFTPSWTSNAENDELFLRSRAGFFDAEFRPFADLSTDPLPWFNPALEADLTQATAATINEIRQAFQVQKLYERDARGGTRLTEVIKAHFGVTSDDARLQRPEYLGGGSQNISVTPIPQTSSTDGTSPQGNLAAYAVSAGQNHAFVKSFTEHCLILGFVSVRADLNYQQGIPRDMSWLTRWDWFWPALQHTGEQAVLNKEIFADGTAADELTFGFQERYGELRYKQSYITGQMRSNHATTLDSWHLAQEFSELPVLDSDFIEENPPIARIIVTTEEPEFLFDAHFKLRHARPMSTYGVPGQMDRF